MVTHALRVTQRGLRKQDLPFHVVLLELLWAAARQLTVALAAK